MKISMLRFIETSEKQRVFGNTLRRVNNDKNTLLRVTGHRMKTNCVCEGTKERGMRTVPAYLSSEDTVDHDYNKALQGVKDGKEDLE